MTFESRFEHGQSVIVDGSAGDHSLVGIVTGHTFRRNYQQIEVSWIHNGQAYAAWFEEWRLDAS